MNNLELWEKVRNVPDNAKKNIGGGRLKGMTDINPMWRIKKLTEEFGQCGIGWYYDILDKHIEECANGEKAAFVDIKLYLKVDGEWSKGISGTGGSSFVAKEKAGFYVNDECYKMALTDAISVVCKALGFGADVYWSKDNTKYNDQKKNNYNEQPKLDANKVKALEMSIKESGKTAQEITNAYKVSNLSELTLKQWTGAMKRLQKIIDSKISSEAQYDK